MKNKTALTLRAHAKINLFLNVGPRRPDGYHTLDTIFQEISLHDTLSFHLAPRAISLRVKGAKLSAGADNLIVRALEMLRKKLKITAGMDVVLDKKIPMGAGLGGGSSDAAAALLAGWTLWKGPVPKKMPPVLFACAKKLGADVSFFLVGGRAQAGGIGDKLKPIKKYPKQHLVLVYPRAHVSTVEAYRWIDQEKPVHLTTKNDFEAVVLPRFPAIRHAKQGLRRLGCSGVMMSGSGSSVFGFVAGKSAAEDIKRALRLKPWDVFVTQMI